jgi:hypothetical protein
MDFCFDSKQNRVCQQNLANSVTPNLTKIHAEVVNLLGLLAERLDTERHREGDRRDFAYFRYKVIRNSGLTRKANGISNKIPVPDA